MHIKYLYCVCNNCSAPVNGRSETAEDHVVEPDSDKYVTCCHHYYRLLKHPNIVSLLGFALSSDEIILIMNFVPEKNLDLLIFGKAKKMNKVSIANSKNIHT